MTMPEEELARRWAQAETLPRGPVQFEAMDLVLRHADAAGYTRQAFDWRMSALTDFHHGGDPARLFLAFSHCLAARDRDPSLGHGHTEHTLLWTFKWVVWALPQFPDIPLDRTEAVLDDMQSRYLRAGYSPHAVYQHRWLVAHHTGEPSAEHWYAKMLTTARDGMSDCSACVPSSQVRHLVKLGRDEEAITIGAPYSRGGCSEQPQWMLSELLLPYLRIGRLDQAVQAHRAGYSRMRSDRHHLDNIAQHVLFCGLTGNEARGLELIERHRPWLANPSSPFAAMEFASAAGQVLRRLDDAGFGDAVVRAAGGVPASTVTAVRAKLTGLARDLAARFDARNDNAHQSRRVEQRLDAEQLVARLPLTALAGRRGDLDPSAVALLEQVAVATAAGDPRAAARTLLVAAQRLAVANRFDDAMETAEEAVRALSRTGLADEVTRCRELLVDLYCRRGRREDALAVLDELLADPTLTGLARARLVEQSASLHGRDKAAELYVNAADAYRAAGSRLGELAALAAAARRGQVEVRVLELLARADQLIEAGPDESADGWAASRAAVDVVAASLLHRRGEHDLAAARARLGLTRLPAEVVGESQLRFVAGLSLLRLDRAPEAEAMARALVADGNDWGAAVLLVLTLRHQDIDATNVMAEHGIDEEDLIDFDWDI